MKLRILLPAFAVLAAAFALTSCGSSGESTDSDQATLAAFCASYLIVQDKTDALSQGGNGSLAERKKVLSEFAASLQNLAADSPEEIQGSVQETADWASAAEVAVSDADSVAAFQKAGAAYGKSHPQPTEASKKADTFENVNCTDGKATPGDTTN